MKIDEGFPVERWLDDERRRIEDDISEGLTPLIGIPPRVQLQFSQGSIEVIGLIVWAWPHVWHAVVAVLDGATNFVKKYVDGALNRQLRRFAGDAPQPGMSVTLTRISAQPPATTPTTAPATAPATTAGYDIPAKLLASAGVLFALERWADLLLRTFHHH